MRKLYKDEKECMADEAQIDLMTEAGWSVNPPEAEAPKSEEVEEVKKTPRRKPIKKIEPEE